MALIVEKIDDGTVIDHIPAGLGLKVLEILKIDKDYNARVALVMNAASRKMGKKDIVKIEGKKIDEKTANKIALIAPNATLNLIKNSEVVEKTPVKLPKELVGVFKCPNPQCMTNVEPIETIFKLEKMEPERKLRCSFCELVFEAKELLV